MLDHQHLSHGFSGKFAEYLNPQCKMRVKEAQSGEPVCDGTVYIAPDGYQMSLGKLEDGFMIRCVPGKRYGGFCPSISYTMNSVAETVKEKAMGIILTGMGGGRRQRAAGHASGGSPHRCTG